MRMRWWSLPLALWLALAPLPCGNLEQAAADSAVLRPSPPVAARKPVRLFVHGIERVDDYAWLRDPNWRKVMLDPGELAPEIRAHIDAENAYAKALLAPLADLRDTLLAEMKGRMEQDESSVPAPDGPYAYWRKFRPGAEHPQIVRARRTGGGEQVLLDGPRLAAGTSFFSFHDLQHSPDHRLYAYTVDDTGSETHELRIRNIASGRDLPVVIADVASFAWAQDSRTLFYVRLDDDHRPRFVYRHRLGTDPAHDVLVFEEKDLGFEVTLASTRSRRFVVISTLGGDTSEEWLIDAMRPQSAPRLVAAREPNVRYELDDWGDRLVIRTNADGAADFKIVTTPASAPGRQNWRDLVAHREGRRIVEAVALAGYLVRLEREDGFERLVVHRKADGSEHAVSFAEPAYALRLEPLYELGTRTIRFEYSSPATPRQIYDYDVESRRRILRKQQKVPSGHDPEKYVVRRLHAVAADGEQVPITLLHRKELRLDRSAPLFLEGYGAYSFIFPAAFDSNLLSLVDRGFVYAIAHVRGGSEKGERWRDAGRLEHKINSFRDFIAVAEHLIETGYTASGRIVARGDSAGGMLMGAVANMRPDLFAGIVARVPYVDTLNTLLDESLPLTVGDFPEFGNPGEDVAAYRNVASYAPYENVAAQPYPHMLVTAGTSDPRVQYWEPAKWVAKLRAMKTNDARILLITSMSEGHFGAAGRFKELDELASIQAFALDVTGMHRPDATMSIERPSLPKRPAPHLGPMHPSTGPAAPEAGQPQHVQ
jgi:oligopeptidase B